jgi:hypothetical protein
MRPPPPLVEITDDELLWINEDDAACLLWDTSIGQDNSKSEQIKDLMSAAFAGPLTPSQQQQAITEFKNDPRLVYHCSLTPQRLPELVENNPMIAIECLLKLMPSNQITDYLSALVRSHHSFLSLSYFLYLS